MKRMMVLMAVLLCSKMASAQKEQVTLDERSKYIYYKVAEAQGANTDTLFNRIIAGLKSSKRFGKQKMDIAKPTVSIKHKMMIYTTSTLAKHEAGEATYTFTAEAKDGKYRYWLTDFVFYPYERTRYGVYAKKPGVDYALEQLKARVGEREFDVYLDQIAKLSIEIGEQMALYVAEPEKKSVEPKMVDTKKW